MTRRCVQLAAHEPRREQAHSSLLTATVHAQQLPACLAPQRQPPWAAPMAVTAAARCS